MNSKVEKVENFFEKELKNLPKPKRFWNTDKHYFFGYESNSNIKNRFVGRFIKKNEKLTTKDTRRCLLDIKRYLLFNNDGINSLKNPCWTGGEKFAKAKKKFLKKF